MKIATQAGVALAIGGLITNIATMPVQATSQPSRMIFTSNRNGNTEIYAANRNGDNMQQLTNNDLNEGGITASPDGSKIAFVVSDEANPDSSISLLNITTGAITTILQTPNTQYNSPAWAPNGKYIAYSFTTSIGPDFLSCIAIYKIATSETNKVSCSDKALLEPAWSPNSQKLIFTQFVYATGGDLYTVHAFKNEEKQYLRSGFLAAYSPLGDKIAFTARDSGYVNQIYVADSSGANPTQITTDSDLHTLADWARDNYLSYTNVTPGTWQFQAKSMRSDGSGTLTIPQKTSGIFDQPGKGLVQP